MGVCMHMLWPLHLRQRNHSPAAKRAAHRCKQGMRSMRSRSGSNVMMVTIVLAGISHLATASSAIPQADGRAAIRSSSSSSSGGGGRELKVWSGGSDREQPANTIHAPAG